LPLAAEVPLKFKAMAIYWEFPIVENITSFNRKTYNLVIDRTDGKTGAQAVNV
jgi:hypothetical protein